MPILQPESAHEISVHNDKLHLAGEPMHMAKLAQKFDLSNHAVPDLWHYAWLHPFEQGHQMLLRGYFHHSDGSLHEEPWGDGGGADGGTGPNGEFGLEMRALKHDAGCTPDNCDQHWSDWEHQDHAAVPLDKKGSVVLDAFNKQDVIDAMNHVAAQPGSGTGEHRGG